MNSLWKSWCKISLSVALFDHQETKDDIWENCKVNIKVTYNTDSVMGEHPQTWAIYFTSFSNKLNGNLAWQTLICYIHHTGFMKKNAAKKLDRQPSPSKKKGLQSSLAMDLQNRSNRSTECLNSYYSISGSFITLTELLSGWLSAM